MLYVTRYRPLMSKTSRDEKEDEEGTIERDSLSPSSPRPSVHTPITEVAPTTTPSAAGAPGGAPGKSGRPGSGRPIIGCAVAACIDGRGDSSSCSSCGFDCCCCSAEVLLALLVLGTEPGPLPAGLKTPIVRETVSAKGTGG